METFISCAKNHCFYHEEPNLSFLSMDKRKSHPKVALSYKRAAGIEPARSAWKAEVLPLNYARVV